MVIEKKDYFNFLSTRNETDHSVQYTCNRSEKKSLHFYFILQIPNVVRYSILKKNSLNVYFSS